MVYLLPLRIIEMTALSKKEWNTSAGLEGSEESEESKESKSSEAIIRMSRFCVLKLQIFPMGAMPLV